ncbi:MAG TPA: cation diffusion facilitator family transporter [Bacteroidales bacterium]|jgi:cobalt-zinc-cadmium efflux system protein|nr:cation transporter [Bacteroidales bacterium]MDI9573963.1 cation diffusion facilitator family transporter [Bacteroidota bacterium]MBP9512353.1 cation transporter [Bacteroidales bacterium]MBP9588793.1 cation transporter [Bacteroidales bacterium]HOE58258.1 cation diffusion facilitator family transporter [Bacteroidales bacterium]
MNHRPHTHNAHTQNTSQQRLGLTIGLNLMIAMVEVVGGIISGSLALISDSVHNLADSVSLIISYFALKLSKKKVSLRNTFGYHRAEILAAFINATILAGITLFLIVQAFIRFFRPVQIKVDTMGIVALIGLGANLAGMILLKKPSSQSLNIRSSYLHLVGDTLSSVAVIIAALLIELTKLTFIDPLITIIISLYIIKETWSVLQRSTDILMMASPTDINLLKIQREIEKMEGIDNIHHVHIWQLDDKTIHFEAHLRLAKNPSIHEADQIRQKIERWLIDNNIQHVTLQIEPSETANACPSNSLLGSTH